MSKATRQSFGESLAEWGGKNADIVVLDADLAKSTKSELFMKKYPERFFEMGISEANMIGVAAGLSFMGKLPFLCSFGCFITGRYDTIRLSVAYSGANVRLVGTHAGVGIGDDGHSQMGLEDVTLMRALPTMGVFQPMDARETELVMNHLIETWKGPAYLRLTRQALPNLLTNEPYWSPGKIYCVKKSSKGEARILLVGTGAGTTEAMKAAEILESAGYGTTVLNAHCLKPFDEEGLAQYVGSHSVVATIEDHSVIGGLGSCVAETLVHLPVRPKFIKFGVQDLFGESGEGEELIEKHGFSGRRVAESIRQVL